MAAPWAMQNMARDGLGNEGAEAMATIVRFIPGVLAATVGFLSILLMNLLGFHILLIYVLFVVIYVIVEVLMDKAMRSYANPSGHRP
jgi:hypothetical protein